jgi:hypothetical protein
MVHLKPGRANASVLRIAGDLADRRAWAPGGVTCDLLLRAKRCIFVSH